MLYAKTIFIIFVNVQRAGAAVDDPAGGQAGGGGLQCGVWDPGRQLAGTDDHWLLADHQSNNHHWDYS